MHWVRLELDTHTLYLYIGCQKTQSVYMLFSIVTLDYIYYQKPHKEKGVSNSHLKAGLVLNKPQQPDEHMNTIKHFLHGYSKSVFVKNNFMLPAPRLCMGSTYNIIFTYLFPLCCHLKIVAICYNKGKQLRLYLQKKHVITSLEATQLEYSINLLFNAILLSTIL